MVASDKRRAHHSGPRTVGEHHSRPPQATEQILARYHRYSRRAVETTSPALKNIPVAKMLRNPGSQRASKMRSALAEDTKLKL